MPIQGLFHALGSVDLTPLNHIYIFIQLCEDKELEVTLIGALDGNQLLKRVRLREGQDGDPCAFDSNYYVSEAEVDELRRSISFCSTKTVWFSHSHSSV